MTVTLAFFFWFMVICVVKVALQVRWARDLHARHRATYPYDVIFRKVGRSPLGRFVIRPDDALEPSFRRDLEEIQRRSTLWDTGLCIASLAIVVALLVIT